MSPDFSVTAWALAGTARAVTAAIRTTRRVRFMGSPSLGMAEGKLSQRAAARLLVATGANPLLERAAECLEAVVPIGADGLDPERGAVERLRAQGVTRLAADAVGVHQLGLVQGGEVFGDGLA